MEWANIRMLTMKGTGRSRTAHDEACGACAGAEVYGIGHVGLLNRLGRDRGYGTLRASVLVESLQKAGTPTRRQSSSNSRATAAGPILG